MRSNKKLAFPLLTRNTNTIRLIRPWRMGEIISYLWETFETLYEESIIFKILILIKFVGILMNQFQFKINFSKK